MAGKKFDLGAYNTDTRKTQAKHNKYSAFLENENDSPDVSSVKESESVKSDAENKPEKMPAGKACAPKKKSSEKKGAAPVSEPEKLTEEVLSDSAASSETPASKRINMAFSDANYRLISEESERLSVSFVYFINSLIGIVDEKDIAGYIGAMTIRRTKENISRRKGKPAKRINLKFSPELHSKLSRGAECYNMTITQYMNTIIEVYAQNANNISI